MRTLFVTFATVFAAELGDETQLAALLFATETGTSKLGVFLAASAALVLSSLLAVVAGDQIARFVSPSTLKIVAGLGFIAIGTWLLIGVRTEL